MYLLGGNSPSTQTAVSPSQTADLPLQTLCVSCLPDGDRMKSSPDDEEKRGTKRRCERGLSTRPHTNYIFSARTAIQSPAMCFLVCLAKCALMYQQEGSRNERTAFISKENDRYLCKRIDVTDVNGKKLSCLRHWTSIIKWDQTLPNYNLLYFFIYIFLVGSDIIIAGGF